jgi:hypothetical protein
LIRHGICKQCGCEILWTRHRKNYCGDTCRTRARREQYQKENGVSYSTAHSRAKKSQNQCLACKNPPKPGFSRCERHLKSARNSGTSQRVNTRFQVLEHYGNKCFCCGERRVEFLAIDHINGGGKRHRKAIKKDGHSFYQWLKVNGFPDGFRTLCHNCNLALGFYGYCPHEKERVGQLTLYLVS